MDVDRTGAAAPGTRPAAAVLPAAPEADLPTDLPAAPEADLPTDLPAAPEADLPAHLAAHPVGRPDPDAAASTPPPPWDTRVEAVLWWHRAPAAARRVPPVSAPRPLLVVGALVRYLESPVGPYEEVLGALVPASLQARVPFLAVDSLRSLQGGRAHWALPKTLARVDRQQDRVTAVGEGWCVTVAPHVRGPRLPVAGLVPVRQPRVDGPALRFRAAGYGRCRLGTVAVDVSSARAAEPASLAGWLLPGRHPGAVLHARLRVGRPRP